jgi:Ca-activated chloride channel family protein
MWGAFKLGKTNPRLSTSGLNSTVATFAAATGSSSNLSVPQLQEPSVLRFVHRVESAAVHYAPTSVDFLRNLRTQDELGNGEGYVSAIWLEEKSVWDYNHGNPSGDPATLGQSPAPATPLVAFYPDDGALVADHPYVILGGDWVDEDQRAAANRFLDFLLEPAQQERFQSLGFRDHAGAPAAEISQDNGLIPSEPTATLTPPDGVVLQKIRETWPTYRKQARMLIVIDLSASMGNVAVGSDRTKLQLAQTAALQAIKELGPDDEVGLWTFSSSGQPYVEQVKIGRVSSNHDELVGAIRGLSADPGNPSELYATVTAALSALGEGFDETRINGMVLLSDGPNEGSSTVTSGEMLAAAGSSVDQEVRIFTIAYGDTADTDTLAELATASLGTAYGAQAPTDILRVFPQVVANF